MGAKMVEFNGWDMPVEYPSVGGIIAEHNAVRTGVGIFDVSHMGDIRLQGPEALPAVQHISMNDASRLAIGQAQYSALLYPQGTFVDDVIVHRLGEDDYLLVINAGTREKDFNWVRDNTRQFNCKVENLSDESTQIAIQGPKGVNLLQKLTDADLSTVKFYWVTRGTVCGLNNILIARTGYTAEDGFEIYVPADEATSAMVWNPGAGCGQRIWSDSVRARCSQYSAARRRPLALRTRNFGYDQCVGSRTRSFLQDGEAGLHRPRSAGDSEDRRPDANIGRARKIYERGIARDGYKVQDDTCREIGYVTSGSYAPFLKKNIALAYVPPQFANVGSTVKVECRSQGVRAQVVPTPFYKRPKKS